MEEYARKSFALADPDYLNQLKEYQKDYETQIMKLRKNAVSAEERKAIKRLEQLWVSFAERSQAAAAQFAPGRSVAAGEPAE